MNGEIIERCSCGRQLESFRIPGCDIEIRRCRRGCFDPRLSDLYPGVFKGVTPENIDFEEGREILKEVEV